jgi:GNAT superfamily N-acetyltransferase
LGPRPFRPDLLLGVSRRSILFKELPTATLESYRGRGLAKALMKHIIAESFEKEHDMLFLAVEAGEWPKEFYERFDVVRYTVEYQLEPREEDSEE